MVDVYVYYRVPRAELAAAVAAAAHRQRELATRWPAVRMGLAQRVDAADLATLMETYQGVADAPALTAALPRDASRHVEVFAPCA